MKKAIIFIIVLLLLSGGLYLAFHKNIISQALGQSPITSSAPIQTTAGQQPNMQPSVSGSPNRGKFANMPAGSQPIFGQVTAVNGNQLSVQRQSRNGNTTSLTVNLSASTQYTGGVQSDISSGTRIGGYGTKNSDGTINAEQIMINPTIGNRNPGQGPTGSHY